MKPVFTKEEQLLLKARTPKEYIDKCIDYFGDNKIFVITSDDINWCKQNFPQDNVFIIDQDKSIITISIEIIAAVRVR